MSFADIEKRLQVLEDIESIKKLKAKYCLAADDNYNPKAMSSLFTEDGVWDGGEFWGKYQGRKEIEEYFQGASGNISFAVHAALTPHIEVEGTKAKGTWYLLAEATMTKGNQAVWGAVRYDEEYVKIDGEWKFKYVKLTTFYWTPYELGWAEKRFVT